MLTDTQMSEPKSYPFSFLKQEKNERAAPIYRAEFTRNKKLIAQYKALRRKLYEIDERFVGFRLFNTPHAEDYDDPDNQMVLLHNGTTCFGGACLRISTPQHPVMLDLENDILPASGKYYFTIKDRFPEMELNKYAYAEATRITLPQNLRTKEAMRDIFQAMLDRCIEYRVRYLFGLGDKIRVRTYRQLFNSIGLPGYIDPKVDIPMRPEYEGKKMYLLYGDMKHFHAVESDPEASILLQPLSNFEFSS